MKQAVKSISKNSDIVIPFFLATLLVILICYNIITHGTLSSTAFSTAFEF
jgi:hypothetical protein